MNRLEKYVFDLYGRWISFTDCSRELLFDIEEALDVKITKEASACKQVIIDTNGNIKGGLLTPKLKPIEYEVHNYAIPQEMIDFKNDRLHFRMLAKLLILNMHLDKEIP